MKELRQYADPSHKLGMRRQCDLPEIHCRGMDKRPYGESEQNLHFMHQVDKLFAGDLTLGVLNMQYEVKDSRLKLTRLNLFVD